MQIVVLTNKSLKEELLSTVEAVSDHIIWAENLSHLLQYKAAHAYIDLVFENSHTSVLQQLLPALIVVNYVEHRVTEIHSSFVRINGWPTFLKSDIIEATTLLEKTRKACDEVFSFFNKKMEWLPDEPGFITARVISMIINEAFISLKEGVSSKEEIDTAMKLGTNYPYGPFEWAEKIGRHKIASLLQNLSKGNNSYIPIEV